MKIERKKLIIHIIPCPAGGGAELLVRELGKRLPSSFYTKILYFDNKPKNGKPVKDIRGNEFFLNVSRRSPRAIIKIRKFVAKECQNCKDVIVHTHLTMPLFFTVIATLFLNVKLVHTEHNTTNKRRAYALLKYLERIIYSRYTKIICISNGVKNSLEKWLGRNVSQKIEVIYNGIKLHTFFKRRVLTERLPSLVSVGSLTGKKGFHNAINAISLINEKIAKYTIVGEGAERSHLEALVMKSDLQEKVKFAGWVDNVEDYLNSADIQLIPSLWEGFGLVAVEGMSTGIPIIASDVEGIREVLSEESPAFYLVKDFENPEAWSQAITKMVSTISLEYDKIQNAARKRAEEFRIEKMIQRYVNVYNNI